MDISTQAGSTVGLFHHPPERSGIVVGRHVAVESLLHALSRHGSAHRYALFCHSSERERVSSQIDTSAGRMEVRDRRELRFEKADFTAFHDNDFDTWTPFALRARAPSPFPVTLVHHTLSYKELLHDAILRLLLAKAQPYDAVICETAATKGVLENLIAHVSGAIEEEHGTRLTFPGILPIIPLGVDTDRLRPTERSAARDRFRIERDAFVLLWLGRLSLIDKADLLPLVQAFAGLRERNPDRKLRLICAGTERPGERFGAHIVEFAKHLGMAGEVQVLTESARFMPFKEHLYSAADVFVSPVDNVQETFGLTPVEAMACGVPQVVTDWDGYRDTVVHGETGFLVPSLWGRCRDEISSGSLLTESAWDHLALAQSVAVDMRALGGFVQRLIDEPSLRQAMSASSRRRAEQVFSWQAVIPRYEKLWSDLSREARAVGTRPSDGARYASPDYGAFFRHYATRELEEETPLRLTDLGRDLVEGRASVPAQYASVWRHLDLPILQRIVAGFAHAAGKGTALTLGRIIAVMAKDTGDPLARDVITRHVLFLIKYGFVEEGAPG